MLLLLLLALVVLVALVIRLVLPFSSSLRDRVGVSGTVESILNNVDRGIVLVLLMLLPAELLDGPPLVRTGRLTLLGLPELLVPVPEGGDTILGAGGVDLMFPPPAVG